MHGIKEVTASVGYAQYTSLGSAVSLSAAPATGIAMPTDYDKRAKRVLVVAEAQAVRWRDDGTAPTASVGMPLAVGETLIYDGPLNRIQFIEQTGGAIINVTYQQ